MSNSIFQNRTIQYSFIGLGVILVLFILRWLFRPKITVTNKTLPPSGNHLILNLETEGTIGDIEPKQRALFGALYDNLFESDHWNKVLPALTFNSAWRIQPQPASKNTVLRFKVWNQAEKAPVDVLFDPYGIMTDKVGESLWQVSAPGAKTIYVPMEDTAQLRAVIAATLQDVSPIEIENI